MGQHAEHIRRLVGLQAHVEKLKTLKEKCFSVFEPYVGITMEYIEDVVNNEWQTLYRYISVYGETNIKYVFANMKDGLINRREFKERMAKTISIIEAKCAQAEKDLKSTEEKFSHDYEDFFLKPLGSKYVEFFFSQPEVKEMIKRFFES